MGDVRLTDLEIIQRYSIAVRGETADRDDLVTALRADLAWLEDGRRARRSAAGDEPTPTAQRPAATKGATRSAAKPTAKSPSTKAATRPSATAKPVSRAASPKPSPRGTAPAASRAGKKATKPAARRGR